MSKNTKNLQNKKEEKKPVPGASRQIKAELTDKIPE